MPLRPTAGRTKRGRRQCSGAWTTGRWRSKHADLGRGRVNRLEAALIYAEYGWPVFPVHTPTRDPTKPCSCRRVTCPQIGNHPCHKNTCKDRGNHPCHQSVCDRAGKHPRTISGVKDATTDKAQIRQWWDMWPSANIGIATGKEAGFFVLDVDPRKGSAKVLSFLEAKHGKLPETRTADTGGGGVHYLFMYPGFSCIQAF